ncbi:putative F-box protein [Cardamine amara subsp. amara]|uniref:F-box protein n=1 Tax=Cardamine amara subsp. amara TaxID=228776 RepID=A0ABD1BIS4_CARAN
MATMMSDLSDDLVEKILCKVPLISLGAARSTCKLWNNLSKDRVLCKAEARQQCLGFMMKGANVCSVRFDLHGIQNEDVEFVEPSIKQIDKFKKVAISQICYSDGLLLLVTKEEDNTSLVVWNPYLGQTRWIQHRNSNSYMYAFGYDNNRNQKILMIAETYFEIFDFDSNSWRVLDVIPDGHIISNHIPQSVSLKGNTYFIVRRENAVETDIEKCLLCFDFSKDRFGQCLSLPFHFNKIYDTVVLSSTGEEQLAVLYKPCYTSGIKIWVTTKIEPNSVSWSNFLTVDITPLGFKVFNGSFFIDQENKLAVLFDISRCKRACIIGENGYLRETPPHWRYCPPHLRHCHTWMCFYAPSLVQISQELELSSFYNIQSLFQ